MRRRTLMRRTAAATVTIAVTAVAFGVTSVPSSSPAPVSAHELRARHSAGQTFLTWREDGIPRQPASPRVKDIIAARSALEAQDRLTFRVYRSQRPIASLDGLTPLAEVPPLTAWNTDLYGRYPEENATAVRYVVEEGKPALPDGVGLYVSNPRDAGESYYAVTAVMNGREQGIVGADNSLETPVPETVGQGKPVLQAFETPAIFTYVENPTLYRYVRWEAPPNFSVEGKAFDYVVGIPGNVAKPAPVGVHLHCWGGSLKGGFGWWYDAGQGAMLVASNDVPYDWWTGFHERVMTSRPPRSADDWRTGTVRPFTQTRMLSFLDWVGTRWQVDRDRTFVAGLSMGGSGAVMLALHHPDRFAWALAWVPVVRPYYSPVFRESYAAVYGPRDAGARMEDGVAPWDHFDSVAYLEAHPEVETPFITFANGKNDGAIGWQQALDFLRLLQQSRRPHVFVWGQGGHGMRAATPGGDARESSIGIRVRQSLPAFTRCSLDNDPGDGPPEHGEAEGQVNAYLAWDADSITDTEASWEITVRLTDRAPQPRCSVDVTARRLQSLKPKPGDRFAWTNRAKGGRTVQHGEAVADQWGLVTLPAVEVERSGNRLRLVRAR